MDLPVSSMPAVQVTTMERPKRKFIMSGKTCICVLQWVGTTSNQALLDKTFCRRRWLTQKILLREIGKLTTNIVKVMWTLSKINWHDFRDPSFILLSSLFPKKEMLIKSSHNVTWIQLKIFLGPRRYKRRQKSTQIRKNNLTVDGLVDSRYE